MQLLISHKALSSSAAISADQLLIVYFIYPLFSIQAEH